MIGESTRSASRSGSGPDIGPRGDNAASARQAARSWLDQGSGGVATWDWNLLTGEVVCSESGKALLNLPLEAAMTYESFLEAIDPADRERVSAAVQHALATRSGYEVEMRVPLPDGGARWVAAMGRGFYRAGAVVRMAGIAVDITGAKHAEAAVREQLELEDQLAKVAESVPGVICSYLLRPDGTACMPFATPAAEEVFGVSRAALAQDFGALAMHIHPEDAPHVASVVAEAARTLSRWHDAFRYLHPTKGLRWLEGWSMPKQQPDGSILWHGYVMDVTDKLAAQEALRDSDRHKSEFLATLSHELRNPLAPIRNALYLLERAAPGSEQASHARQVIERQTQHLTRLVDDLLDVNRISRAKVFLQRTRLELGDLVRRTCEDHRAIFEQRRIEVRVTGPAGPAWVDADATRVAQIVGNLLQNAAKFTQEGGHVNVSVSISAAGDQAEIHVLDDGVGLTPELLPHVFEPFVQADSGLARTKGGLGLGLALVKGLAELHGGWARAESVGPERGAELVVGLSIAPGPGPAPRASGVAGAAAGALDILVIEDNVDAAQTLLELLELLGHRVRVAHDGRGGIALAREATPDVVLCDVGLPDLDGHQVARALRADPALHGVRLVALSGYAQPEDRQRALEAGFDAHLGKPAPLEELTALLAQPAAAAPGS